MTFQGDEGAFLGTGGGGTGEANRYPMQWARCDAAMSAHYAQLARMKRDATALRSAPYRAYHAEGALLAWARGEPGEGEVLAVFNAGADRRPLVLPEGRWSDLRTGAIFRDRVAVDALDWRYLRRSLP